MKYCEEGTDLAIVKEIIDVNKENQPDRKRDNWDNQPSNERYIQMEMFASRQFQDWIDHHLISFIEWSCLFDRKIRKKPYSANSARKNRRRTNEDL